MAEKHEPGTPHAVDGELNYRGIFGFTIGLAVVCVVVFALMWGIAVWQKKRLVARDAPPPVLAEAREKVVPAGPLLQSDPVTDLKALRAREDAVLSGCAWADPAHAHARVPADRALEIVAAKGFPPRTAPPPAPAPEVKK
jgi:hypothetical protein